MTKYNLKRRWDEKKGSQKERKDGIFWVHLTTLSASQTISADERWTGKKDHRQATFYTSIFLKGMRKTMKSFSQCSWYHSRDSNLAHPSCNASTRNYHCTNLFSKAQIRMLSYRRTEENGYMKMATQFHLVWTSGHLSLEHAQKGLSQTWCFYLLMVTRASKAESVNVWWYWYNWTCLSLQLGNKTYLLNLCFCHVMSTRSCPCLWLVWLPERGAGPQGGCRRPLCC